MEIKFTLNGAQVFVEADPAARAVDILREKFGLTGTKEGCGSGECGACSILVDGESRLSCLMLAAQLEDKNIVTIEGVSAGGDLHPVQRAFIENGAVQCGYCSPGMVISAIDLLNRNADPDEAEIREAISGNLCRCTGYQNITAAIAIAAQKMRDEK